MTLRERALMRKLIRSTLTIAALYGAVAASALAQSVTFPGARGTDFASIDAVKGTIQLPATPQEKAPAVLILHGSGGIDGRGAFHASALNKAGFLTLEIFMFPPGGRNKGGHETTLTHAYGALKYLATRPDVDASRIGAMGFSWGGNMALKLASEKIRQAFEADVGTARFAALASFYPVCWQHLATATSEQPEVRAKYAALTGAPVLLLAGGQDDYGPPADCANFIAALTEADKKSIQFHVYPEATHGWDGPAGRDRTIQDPSAHQGRGGPVRMYTSPPAADDSRLRAVAHFTASMPSR